MRTIRNENFEIKIAEFGAELQSIKSQKSGREFMWQNETGVWAKHSPVLFPNVGARMDNKITVDGVEYPAIPHGFASIMEFEVTNETENSCELLLKANPETKKYLPYDFYFYLTYSICGNVLKISHEIKNNDNKKIYFSVGAHTSFNCKMGDILKFEKKETLSRYVKGKNYHINEVRPYLNDEDTIVIKEDTFIEDALIFNNTKSDYITLNPTSGKWTVKVYYKGAPYLGLWAKPGAEYVCIEPWFGIDDFDGDTDYEIKNKRGIVGVCVGESFKYDIDIEITEE